MISAHLERLEIQLNQTRADVTSLRRLLLPPAAAIEVEHRAFPAATVAAISGIVEKDNVLDWYSAAAAELDRALRQTGHRPTGPRGGLYDNDLFTHDRGEAIVYVPVTDPPSIGRVKPFVVPAADLAVTVHPGPHNDIDVSYGALGTYVVENELVLAGPVHEIYLVGPRDTDDSNAWRTEIGWPVFRTTTQ